MLAQAAARDPRIDVPTGARTIPGLMMEPRLVGRCRRLVRAAGLLVAADRRDDWRREWDAELRWYGPVLARRDRFELVRRSAGER